MNFDTILDALEEMINEAEKERRFGRRPFMDIEQAWAVCKVLSLLIVRGYKPTPDEQARFDSLELRRKAIQRELYPR